jgi:hypothetical protein
MSGNLDPNRSPMTAPVTLRAAGSGVRRLNNVPLMIVFAVAVIVGGASPLAKKATIKERGASFRRHSHFGSRLFRRPAARQTRGMG